MRTLFIWCLLPILAVEVPSTTPAEEPRVHSVAVLGLVMCGHWGMRNVRIRLFRVQQKDYDDLNQILDETITTPLGWFLLQGNTIGFPPNETDMDPVVSFYHTCDDDINNVNETGYRRFDLHIPRRYVTMAEKAYESYYVKILNLQFVFPGERRVTNIEEKLTTPRPTEFWWQGLTLPRL